MRRNTLAGTVALVLALQSFAGVAAERRALAEVTVDAFTKETQATPSNAGDQHIALVWWVPLEFWQSLTARDTTTTDKGKEALLDALRGVSLLAIVQADVTSMGAFHFYPEAVVASKLEVSRIDAAGKAITLVPLQELSPDLEVALGVFKPILGSAMGNLGKNLHFYVLNDKAEGGGRILDPYARGALNVGLAKADGTKMKASIQTPINALFVPRKCPNGQEAHISWKFCPWNGEPLRD